MYPSWLHKFCLESLWGRITDNALVRRSGYLQVVPPGSHVLADRGFKQLESDLAPLNVTLLRPSSVAANEKKNRDDVVQSRRISAVRIHIERAIGRIREFRFLDIHSTIDHNLVHLIDHAVVVVAALTNLQGPLIRV